LAGPSGPPILSIVRQAVNAPVAAAGAVRRALLLFREPFDYSLAGAFLYGSRACSSPRSLI